MYTSTMLNTHRHARTHTHTVLFAINLLFECIPLKPPKRLYLYRNKKHSYAAPYTPTHADEHTHTRTHSRTHARTHTLPPHAVYILSLSLH